ncbi:putative multidrug resistance-associated protein [Talaromyces proteolyticus]|uniref:Multidrug resistance-associated protein n=1 Tax=Talaromyces proteolyticus TaxID=1131652 RepID=A0AAD4KY93_9EURO|nr:putative multidrug resistance-associated protein [Talaromyces proteolyticus]KAH8703765.1 putative multidrug resistance-associated protein [Talaromyces proteolyticus]
MAISQNIENCDDQFGPRVNIACRSFDFTLLFEDAFFIALPATLFLLLFPLRLRALRQSPVKVDSYRLATWKLGVLAVLFICHLLFLAFSVRSSRLYTKLSLSSEILNVISVAVAIIHSLLEDQRSLCPSDLLVLYFSAFTIFSIPRLRSLWLIDADPGPKIIWTIIFTTNVLAVIIESVNKTNILQPHYQSSTPEQTAGFWSRSFFIWVLPFFHTGYTKHLQLTDIPNIDKDIEEQLTFTYLDSAWIRTHGQHRLLRAAFAAYRWSFLSAIPPRLALSAFTLCQPFLIDSTVSNLSSSSDENQKVYGRALVGGFVLVYLGIAISRAVYWRQTYRMIAKIRSGLTAKIYRHMSILPGRDLKDSEAVTLMGTDVERIVDSLTYVHELWASIVEVGIATWLLVRQVSFASLMPLLVGIMSVIGASYIAARFGPAQRAWTERVQKRIAVTINMLRHIDCVKMLNLSGVLSETIEELRSLELRTSEKFRALRILGILVSNTPTTLAPFLTFAVYAIIMAVRKDEPLLLAQAFASLSLINLLTDPVLLFCQSLPSFFQAVSCFRRIEEFCLKEPAALASQEAELVESGHELTNLRNTKSHGTLISFQHADIAWSSDSTEPVLRDLTLTINAGFTAIVGPIASGKSTILESIIGETIVLRGSMRSSISSGIAFCPQPSWLMNTTIRQNITGDTDIVDQKWYEFCVSVCCLKHDLQQMPRGDLSMAGSNGSSLSGGQQQRVALARAVYSRHPIVILDEVMSGLDPMTTSDIISGLFSQQGYFRKAGITVIIVTHNELILPHMDTIIAIKSGSVLFSGPYSDMVGRQQNFGGLKVSSLGTEILRSAVQSDYNQSSNNEVISKQSTPNSQAETSLRESVPQKRKGNWYSYIYYARSARSMNLFLWAFFTLVGAVTTSYTNIWIEKWTDANQKQPNIQLGFYLGIYTMLVVLANVSILGECWVFFIKVINNTALKMHSDLLKVTMRAPFQFFQKTDVGSIINRYLGLSYSLIILCILGKYLTATVPILIAVLFLVQRYYLRTSRRLRLIDIEVKAPLYNLFVNLDCDSFYLKHGETLNQAQRPFYMLFCVQQWLQLVLDLVIGALAVLLVVFATSVTSNVSAGSIGVALVLILQFNSVLTQTIQAWTRLETTIGAVTRVQEFIYETPSDPTCPHDPSLNWPEKGGIRFHHVTACHDPDTPPILQDVNLTVNPREKIALCGSTGSGKTSLIMTLLRMMDVVEGQITIDEMDISLFQGEQVRSRINVISQQPFFLRGTLKFNLDPRNLASNEAIETALRRVGLWEKLVTPGTQQFTIDHTESRRVIDQEFISTEWSHGERQLFCLARALLKSDCRILILDEATSGVDARTEAIMQEIIDTEFRDWTVISVLHRFTYITSFDKVAVLRRGKLVECDSPQVLLGRESAFGALYHGV